MRIPGRSRAPSQMYATVNTYATDLMASKSEGEDQQTLEVFLELHLCPMMYTWPPTPNTDTGTIHMLHTERKYNLTRFGSRKLRQKDGEFEVSLGCVMRYQLRTDRWIDGYIDG